MSAPHGELVVLLGDAHIGQRASGVPEKFKKMLVPGKMQALVSTGNLCSSDTYNYFKGITPRMYAVRGDMDDGEKPVEEEVVFQVGEFRIGVMHGHQIVPWGDREALATAARRLNCNILVTGHTHCGEIVDYGNQTWFINPGSITGAYTPLKREVIPSFVLLSISQNQVKFYLYELNPKTGEVDIKRSRFSKPSLSNPFLGMDSTPTSMSAMEDSMVIGERFARTAPQVAPPPPPPPAKPIVVEEQHLAPVVEEEAAPVEVEQAPEETTPVEEEEEVALVEQEQVDATGEELVAEEGEEAEEREEAEEEEEAEEGEEAEEREEAEEEEEAEGGEEAEEEEAEDEEEEAADKEPSPFEVPFGHPFEQQEEEELPTTPLLTPTLPSEELPATPLLDKTVSASSSKRRASEDSNNGDMLADAAAAPLPPKQKRAPPPRPPGVDPSAPPLVPAKQDVEEEEEEVWDDI